MSRATEDLFDLLHGLQAETLIAELKRTAESGEGVPPALLAQVNKFLKDNGIDQPAAAKEVNDTLKATMPDFDDPSVHPGVH